MFFFKRFFFIFNCVCVWGGGKLVHMSAGPRGGQKRAFDPLELEFQDTVGH